jgi:hypothetical protein
MVQYLLRAEDLRHGNAWAEDAWYPHRVKAYDAESAAIKAELPRYNVMGSQAWRDECARRVREEGPHRNRVRAGSAAAHGASRAVVQDILRGHGGSWGSRPSAETERE